MAELVRDSSVTVALGLAGATEVTATIIRNGVEVHFAEGDTLTLPFKIIGYDGPFQVRWEFFVSGDPTLHTRYESYEVVTRLTEIDENVPEEIDGERMVRRIIQALTGQSFGFSFGSRIIQGQGERTLTLPERLIQLTGVSLNYYPYDAIPFGAINIINGGWALNNAQGTDYLSPKQAPPDDAIYSANGVITAPGFTRIWRPDTFYVVTGSWGYEGVPEDISEAARLLIEDYKCDEDTYRNKFIANMRSADWRIEFNPQTWSGTGNVKADQLIAPYIRTGYGII